MGGVNLYSNATIKTDKNDETPIKSLFLADSLRTPQECHEKVLVFVKTNPKIATEECGDIEVYMPQTEIEI